MIMYTCVHKECNTKQARTFSKHSYTKGVVILRCEGCSELHLIADNLGWFDRESYKKGHAVNIERIMEEKGENVLKFVSNEGMEFVPEEEVEKLKEKKKGMMEKKTDEEGNSGKVKLGSIYGNNNKSEL